MAPEMLSDISSTANPAIDIWAIGVMLYCMVFDKFPFNGENADIIRSKIKSSDIKIPKDTPVTDEFADFVKGLLRKDPASRMDIYTMKTHRWLQLSEGALQLKSELAKDSYKREL